MIVAMFVMPAVDVPLDDVVDMSVVRDRHVLAADAVLVIAFVRIARMARIARLQIVRTEFVLVDMIAVRMVEMAVVRVVHVVVMLHG